MSNKTYEMRETTLQRRSNTGEKWLRAGYSQVGSSDLSAQN